MGTERTLTKEQRIDILKWVIKMLIKEKCGFMCIIIKVAISNKLNIEYGSIQPFYYFPELIKYKPSDVKIIDTAWFFENNYKSRVKILNNVIKELEKYES